MRLIVVRHGETEWNRDGKIMGQQDSSLTERGISQAKSLARRFDDIPKFSLYASDLGRARETASIISARRKVEITFCKNLRERSMGIFEGLTKVKVQEKYPLEWSKYIRNDPDYVIPGGESARQRDARILQAMDHFSSYGNNETVVAVSHSGVLKGIVESIFVSLPTFGNLLTRSNASYNSLLFSEGHWSLETWNDISHLTGVNFRS